MVMIVFVFQQLNVPGSYGVVSIDSRRHPTESAIPVISTAVISRPSKTADFRSSDLGCDSHASLPRKGCVSISDKLVLWRGIRQ